MCLEFKGRVFLMDTNNLVAVHRVSACLTLAFSLADRYEGSNFLHAYFQLLPFKVTRRQSY